MSFTTILLLTLYFSTMAWIIAYGPSAIAVIDSAKLNTPVDDRHKRVAFALSVIPVLNFILALVILWVLFQIDRLSRNYEGVENDREDFERFLREIESESDDPPSGGAV